MNVLSQLSGGYDSVAACVRLIEQGHTVHGLFFDLGQVYVEQERAAVDYASQYFAKHWPKQWLGHTELQVAMELTRANDGSPSEYIPVRNFVLGAHSANYALAHGYECVAVGSKTTTVRADDPYSFSDCSVEFYEGMSSIVDFCSEDGDSLKFLMPLIDHDTALTKGQVVQLILDTGMDISQLWTCYKAEQQPCGTCYHCKDVKKAFAEINADYSWLFAA